MSNVNNRSLNQSSSLYGRDTTHYLRRTNSKVLSTYTTICIRYCSDFHLNNKIFSLCKHITISVLVNFLFNNFCNGELNANSHIPTNQFLQQTKVKLPEYLLLICAFTQNATFKF